MKTVKILWIIVLSFAYSFLASAQCDSEIYTSQALKTLAAGFTFTKAYKIDGKEGTKKQIEYTCVMNKDNDYMIRVASKDGGSHGIIVTLYDAQRNELATNQISNKSFTGWTYKCNAAGIYYITFTFKDAPSFCGGAVMGFKSN
jgi:hypothetical protein